MVTCKIEREDSALIKRGNEPDLLDVSPFILEAGFGWT